MEKPRLFISAVTRELGSARQRIANILTRKGYEPVWQDIFGTEPGDLRAGPGVARDHPLSELDLPTAPPLRKAHPVLRSPKQSEESLICPKPQLLTTPPGQGATFSQTH